MTSDAPRRKLYPHIEPNLTGFLEVDSGHQLYYEECGNPKGKPVVFLHGGPGGDKHGEAVRLRNRPGAALGSDGAHTRHSTG